MSQYVNSQDVSMINSVADYQNGMDYIKYDSQYNQSQFNQQDINQLDNPTTIKLVNGLQDDFINNNNHKLSSLYAIDKDMSQMPIILLPQSNKYGLQDNNNIHFQKDNKEMDDNEVWKNITKDILNPFAPSLKPFIHKYTDQQHQDQKQTNQNTTTKDILVKKFKKLQDNNINNNVLLKNNPNSDKNKCRQSNSLDHFFQYFTKEDGDEEEEDISPNSNLLSTNKQKHSHLIAKTYASTLNNPIRNKKASFSITNTQKKIIKNTQTNASTFKIASNNTNNNNNNNQESPLQTDDDNQKRRVLLDQMKNVNSPKNANQTQQSQDNTFQPRQKLSNISNFNSAIRNNNNNNNNNNDQKDKDVFDILDRQYRKKYNLEYKIQLRRKSCYCSNCGACTNFENKYQNIVNPMLIRKKKRFTKIFKVVNFLQIINKSMRALPSNPEIENITQDSIPNNTSSNGNHPESLTEIKSFKNIGNNNSPQRQTVKMDAPSLIKIELGDIQEDSPGYDTKQNNNYRSNNSKHHTQIKKLQQLANKNKLKRSFTLNTQNDDNIKENNHNKKRQYYMNMNQDYDSSDCSPSFFHSNNDNDDTSIYRQQQSFQIEINSENDFSMSSRRHKVIDVRSKNKKQSYIKEKSTFLNFIEKKIKEAKKKREQDEIKYVGKTPLTVIMQILSQGKKNSIFNIEESQKKLQKFIENKKPHTSFHQQRNKLNGQQNQQQFKLNQFNNININDQTQQNFYSNDHHHNNQINKNNDENIINLTEEQQKQQKLKDNNNNNYIQAIQHMIPPLALFQKKINKKQLTLKEKERGFYISPIGQRRLDQNITTNTTTNQGINSTTITTTNALQSARTTTNGFRSVKKINNNNIEDTLNPLKIVRHKLNQKKEIDPYLQNNNLNQKSMQQMKKQQINIRENKQNSAHSSQSQHNLNMASYSTLRQTNTAQTTDRSSILSNSNKKTTPITFTNRTHDNNNGNSYLKNNSAYIRNGFNSARQQQQPQQQHYMKDINNGSSLSTMKQLNSTTQQQQQQSIDQLSFNHSCFLKRQTSPQLIQSNLVSPQLKKQLEENSMINKCQPYFKSILSPNNRNAKSPQFHYSSSIQNQFFKSQSFKILHPKQINN